MSQNIGRVTSPKLPIHRSPHISNLYLADPPRLLPNLAPRLPLLRHNPSPRPPRLPHRRPPYGQTQAYLEPLYRLRRLRRRDRVQRRLCHRQEDAAEEVLQPYNAPGQSEGYQYGEYSPEMGRRGGSEEGGERHVAEE